MPSYKPDTTLTQLRLTQREMEIVGMIREELCLPSNTSAVRWALAQQGKAMDAKKKIEQNA